MGELLKGGGKEPQHTFQNITQRRPGGGVFDIALSPRADIPESPFAPPMGTAPSTRSSRVAQGIINPTNMGGLLGRLALDAMAAYAGSGGVSAIQQGQQAQKNLEADVGMKSVAEEGLQAYRDASIDVEKQKVRATEDYNKALANLYGVQANQLNELIKSNKRGTPYPSVITPTTAALLDIKLKAVDAMTDDKEKVKALSDLEADFDDLQKEETVRLLAERRSEKTGIPIEDAYAIEKKEQEDRTAIKLWAEREKERKTKLQTQLKEARGLGTQPYTQAYKESFVQGVKDIMGVFGKK